MKDSSLHLYAFSNKGEAGMKYFLASSAQGVKSTGI